jgi:hypothetical protein
MRSAVFFAHTPRWRRTATTKRTSRVVGLFIVSDTSSRLADRLGNECWFDAAGNLTDVLLGPNRRMPLDYGRQEATSERSPYAGRRLVAAGVERRWAGEFDSDGPAVRFLPETDGAFTAVALLSDGSFVLSDASGRESRFDRTGRFAGERLVAPEAVVTGLSEGAIPSTSSMGSAARVPGEWCTRGSGRPATAAGPSSWPTPMTVPTG